MDVEIRSVTVFIPYDCTSQLDFKSCVTTALSQAAKIRSALESSGFCVQTTRIATKGPASFGTTSGARKAAATLQQAVGNSHYASLGTVHPSDDASFMNAEFLTEILLENPSLFLTTSVTNRDTSSIDIPAIRTSARVIKQLSKQPFNNARFAALANVRPGCPFFPAAYAPHVHNASYPTSLAIQGASLGAACVAGATTASACATLLTERIEHVSERLLSACAPYDITLDFSLAPFPTAHCSTSLTISQLTGGAFGHPGTIAAAATLASAIDAAKFPRAGFCGIMLPVLEDVGLANCPALSLNDLLSVSSVCGTGLDTVPLPGEIDVECLERIIIDVASLSTRLGGKQLTARLMPIPGKKMGEMTEFEFDFFCNARVLSCAEKGNGSHNNNRLQSCDKLSLRALH